MVQDDDTGIRESGTCGCGTGCPTNFLPNNRRLRRTNPIETWCPSFSSLYVLLSISLNSVTSTWPVGGVGVAFSSLRFATFLQVKDGSAEEVNLAGGTVCVCVSLSLQD